MSQHPERRHGVNAAAAVTAALLALTLAACGEDTSSESPSNPTSTAPNGDVVNDVDVAFATEMIPHHAQALQMVDLTLGRPLDPAVEEVMDGIRDAQSPEIETMSGWLTDWGQPVPETGADDEMASMPGMLSDDQLATLDDARGQEFQAMLLELMTAHHEGAITMAESEIDDGAYGPAQDLAREIIAGQEREIATMQDLVDRLG